MSQNQTFQFTKRGYQALKDELAKLEKRRPIVVVNLTNAREQGDLSENAGYHAAKEELGQIDSRIKELRYLLRVGKVVESQDQSKITFGNTVTLKNDQSKLTFTLVEKLEANPKEGKISTDSPIGAALVGKKIGDQFEVTTPSGQTKFKVLKIAL